MCTYRGVNAHLSYCLNSVLYVKVLIGVFNHDQEKALVGAFSVIVKTNCETDGSFAALVMIVTVSNVTSIIAASPRLTRQSCYSD